MIFNAGMCVIVFCVLEVEARSPGAGSELRSCPVCWQVAAALGTTRRPSQWLQQATRTSYLPCTTHNLSSSPLQPDPVEPVRRRKRQPRAPQLPPLLRVENHHKAAAVGGDPRRQDDAVVLLGRARARDEQRLACGTRGGSCIGSLVMCRCKAYPPPCRLHQPSPHPPAPQLSPRTHRRRRPARATSSPPRCPRRSSTARCPCWWAAPPTAHRQSGTICLGKPG
jgi:hypothetical protein